MDDMHRETILEIQNLKTFFYLSRGVARAVNDVSFEVRRGEVLGLVGESGCGKTITCLSIVGLLPAAARIVSGKIIFNGINLVDQNKRYLRNLRGRKISMIMQDPSTSLNPVLTIGEQVAEAIRVKFNYRGAVLWSKVIESLELMRLPNPKRQLRSYPHQLSGGMKQRVAGAIALSVSPELVIADEPTTALDVTIQAQYLQELRKLQRKFGLSAVYVTHDFGIVAAICDRVCVMYAGKIVEQAEVNDLLENHRHPYTAGLLSSLPKVDKRVSTLPTISGEPPSLLQIPAGCSFSPRCQHSRAHCGIEDPPVTEISTGHLVRCWKAIQTDW
jgi:oligopeptide/dipeptide ABC transporter ATP-binding protein